ncbi:MAG TPA: hypothetical protein VEY93_10250, partial [Longimicrobium sp.]|nr:hypothetical protein [Longimicrobium sp.]
IIPALVIERGFRRVPTSGPVGAFVKRRDCHLKKGGVFASPGPVEPTRIEVDVTTDVGPVMPLQTVHGRIAVILASEHLASRDCRVERLQHLAASPCGNGIGELTLRPDHIAESLGDCGGIGCSQRLFAIRIARGVTVVLRIAS